MAAINLFFGAPCDEWTIEAINTTAISQEISCERATFLIVKHFTQSVTLRKYERSYLDCFFSRLSREVVLAPKVMVKTYPIRRRKYPKLVLEDSYLINIKTGTQIPISPELVNAFGQEMKALLGMEYLHHSYTGHQSLLNQKQGELLFTSIQD